MWNSRTQAALPPNAVCSGPPDGALDFRGALAAAAAAFAKLFPEAAAMRGGELFGPASHVTGDSGGGDGGGGGAGSAAADVGGSGGGGALGDDSDDDTLAALEAALAGIGGGGGLANGVPGSGGE